MTDMYQVKEGFLCPLCMIDMGSMNKLSSHYIEKHSEEMPFKKFLRGVMDQAKKIVNKDDLVSRPIARKDMILSLDIYNSFQEFGAHKSHMEEFIEIRNRRLEGFSAETNKLIIRLDKLLMNLPTDPARRKLHEQTVVPWIDGEDVSRCPECTKLFHLARRKHHCRLCGSIMCHDCSCFLSLAKARSILLYTVAEPTLEAETNVEDDLRICQYCLTLLESRELMKASRNCKPLISELYDKLRSIVLEVDNDIELFEKMSLSLNEGKSTYHLHDAQALWGKLMKSSEKISIMGAKIAALDLGENSAGLSRNQLLLQKNVNMGANAYIQSKILSLPTLPSEEMYSKLQEERRRKIEDEIRRQKQEDLTNALLASQFKTEYVLNKPNVDKLQKDVVMENWIPVIDSAKYLTDDPIIVQMNNIQSYIKQAREAYKFDEVACLEKNLQELREEYLRQQS